MLSIKIFENSIEYIYIITNNEDSFEYRWGKIPTEGQTVEDYIQKCKHEAELLSQYEIDKKQPPQEITI